MLERQDRRLAAGNCEATARPPRRREDEVVGPLPATCAAKLSTRDRSTATDLVAWILVLPNTALPLTSATLSETTSRRRIRSTRLARSRSRLGGISGAIPIGGPPRPYRRPGPPTSYMIDRCPGVAEDASDKSQKTVTHCVDRVLSAAPSRIVRGVCDSGEKPCAGVSLPR
jgi:hypothetical protein